MSLDRDEFLEHYRRVAETAIPDDGFRADFVDVGGGEAVLVRSGTETLLYDGGPTAETSGKLTGPMGGEGTLVALDELGVDRIDHVVVSHLDTDHYAQVVDVIEELGSEGVGTVHFPGAAVDDHDLTFAEAIDERGKETNEEGLGVCDASVERLKTNRYIRGLADGIGHYGVDTRWATAEDPDADDPQIPLDGVDVTVCNPPAQPDNPRSEDNRSVVLHLQPPEGGDGLLLTGDVNRSVERTLTDEYPALLATVAGYDAPKHGSNNLDGDLFDHCDPALVVMCNHRHGRNGKPDSEAVKRFTGREALSTGTHGAVALDVTPEELRLTHARRILRTHDARDVDGQDVTADGGLTERLRCELGETEWEVVATDLGAEDADRGRT